MDKTEKKNNKLQELKAKVGPGLEKTGKVMTVVGKVLYHLRKVALAVPVVIVAIMLAKHNMDILPATVGIDLQANGQFAQSISREMAVYGPLAVTGGCLLMMAFSRKVIYPWLVSVFTLVLPLLMMLLNFFQ
jgi:hypothetical protein